MKNLFSFRLQFLAGDLSSRVRLHLQIQPVELFHAVRARSFCSYGGAEFLKMRSDTIECEAGFAIGTLDSGH